MEALLSVTLVYNFGLAGFGYVLFWRAARENSPEFREAMRENLNEYISRYAQANPWLTITIIPILEELLFRVVFLGALVLVSIPEPVMFSAVVLQAGMFALLPGHRRMGMKTVWLRHFPAGLMFGTLFVVLARLEDGARGLLLASTAVVTLHILNNLIAAALDGVQRRMLAQSS